MKATEQHTEIIYADPGTFTDFIEEVKRGERVARNWWADKKYLRLENGVLHIVEAHWHLGYWLPRSDKGEPLDLRLFDFNQFAHVDWLPWLLKEDGTQVLQTFSPSSRRRADLTNLFDIFTDHFTIRNNKVYLR